MVVDVVVIHWLSLVATEEASSEGLGRDIQRKVSLFYAYDGLIASMWPEWIQGAFGVLMGLFERVGL